MAKKPKVISKHKQSGKHSLKYDTIFKGKKEEPLEEDYTQHYFNDNFTYDPQSMYYQESMNNSEYVRQKEVKEKVYEILSEHTDINFENNRRKPSKDDFNHYYFLLKTNLDNDKFTNIEMFNELAYYFSDNLFNMLKLLDPKWRDLIIDELENHIGEPPENSKEIMPKNITVGAEIEFEMETDEGLRIITGVVKDTNHEDGEYEVDSYENIYIVPIECFVKILNNQKFRYNLNKLKNLDIL